MKIIKEVCIGETSTRCVIRTNTYARNLEHINELLKIAQRDFPNLIAKEVDLVVYGGERYAKTLGIEFNPPSVVPNTYEAINRLEAVLA